MKRIIPFAVLCSVCIYLTWWVCRLLTYSLHWASFAVGVGVSALAGLVWFRVSDWWSTMAKPYQPQSVKSDTKQTPFQVLSNALLATVKLSLVIALAIVLMAVMTGVVLGWPTWLRVNP